MPDEIIPAEETPAPEAMPEAMPDVTPEAVPEAVPEAPSAVEEVVSDLKDALETIVEAVVGNAPAPNTVTVDFGPAGVLTGCTVTAQYFGQEGAEHTVHVPVEGGYVALHGIPARFIK